MVRDESRQPRRWHGLRWRWQWTAWFLCVGLAAGTLAADGKGKQAERLGRAEALLEAGQAEEAKEILDGILAKGKPSAKALLLRSTSRVMLADVQGAVNDLKRATEVDPTLRQAWLNLAGIEIAQRRFETGYQALVQAQKLDPTAPDNDLNLGAVLLMLGRQDEAVAHLQSYLQQQRDSAEAYYLVASNYALAGLAAPAVAHLQRAIGLNERLRLRARSDDRFLSLDDPAYTRLINTDSYSPPVGAHTSATAFGVPYDRGDNRLLYAVLEALQRLEIAYDPQIETTDHWALVWSDLRIKVSNQSNGTGVVRLSAPADRYTAESWQKVSQRLFTAIHQALSG